MGKALKWEIVLRHGAPWTHFWAFGCLPLLVDIGKNFSLTRYRDICQFSRQITIFANLHILWLSKKSRYLAKNVAISRYLEKYLLKMVTSRHILRLSRSIAIFREKCQDLAIFGETFCDYDEKSRNFVNIATNRDIYNYHEKSRYLAKSLSRYFMKLITTKSCICSYS